jgi:hypothetical protein
VREILIYFFVVVVVTVTYPLLRRHNANRIHVHTSPFLLVLLFSFAFFGPHLFSLFSNSPYAGSIAKNGAAPSFVALFSRRPETGQRWPTLICLRPPCIAVLFVFMCVFFCPSYLSTLDRWMSSTDVARHFCIYLSRHPTERFSTFNDVELG